MKELRYLDKYLLKYKKHLILGLIFIIISNLFQIVPGPVGSILVTDLVVDNIALYKSLGATTVQKDFLQGVCQRHLAYMPALSSLQPFLPRPIPLLCKTNPRIVMSRLIEYGSEDKV